MVMAATGPYSVGEKVLVPHTDKYYEAKVLKAEYREDKQWYYMLHYTGWNKKYDEWVEQSGLNKSPSGNAALLKKQATASAASGGSGGSASRELQQQQQKGQKRRKGSLDAGDPMAVDSGAARTFVDVFDLSADLAGTALPAAEQGDPGAPRPHPTTGLELSLALKKQLLEDYDCIHEDGRLVPLPRKPCVNDVLASYHATMVQGGSNPEGVEELCLGLRIYFDKALPHCLLYRQERAQASKALADGRIPSAVYGAEHFLRLFVKLPELLPLTSVPDDQLRMWVTRCNLVVRFLHANMASFFLGKDDYAEGTC